MQPWLVISHCLLQPRPWQAAPLLEREQNLLWAWEEAQGQLSLPQAAPACVHTGCLSPCCMHCLQTLVPACMLGWGAAHAATVCPGHQQVASNRMNATSCAAADNGQPAGPQIIISHTCAEAVLLSSADIITRACSTSADMSDVGSAEPIAGATP